MDDSERVDQEAGVFKHVGGDWRSRGMVVVEVEASQHVRGGWRLRGNLGRHLEPRANTSLLPLAPAAREDPGRLDEMAVESEESLEGVCPWRERPDGGRGSLALVQYVPPGGVSFTTARPSGYSMFGCVRNVSLAAGGGGDGDGVALPHEGGVGLAWITWGRLVAAFLTVYVLLIVKELLVKAGASTEMRSRGRRRRAATRRRKQRQEQAAPDDQPVAVARVGTDAEVCAHDMNSVRHKIFLFLLVRETYHIL